MEEAGTLIYYLPTSLPTVLNRPLPSERRLSGCWHWRNESSCIGLHVATSCTSETIKVTVNRTKRLILSQPNSCKLSCFCSKPSTICPGNPHKPLSFSKWSKRKLNFLEHVTGTPTGTVLKNTKRELRQLIWEWQLAFAVIKVKIGSRSSCTLLTIKSSVVTCMGLIFALWHTRINRSSLYWWIH